MSKDIEPVATRDGQAAWPLGSAMGKVRRQRRPTGAPPPLPHPITISTTAWLISGAVVLAGAFLASQHTPWLRIDDQASTWVLRLLARIRTPRLTDVADAINAAGSGWGATVLGLLVVALTAVFRRWRHLLVFMCSLFFLEIVGTAIYFGLSRPRPYGVPIIASWGGYSGVSPPVAVITIFLMGAAYCLAVPGRPRSYIKAGGRRGHRHREDPAMARLGPGGPARGHRHPHSYVRHLGRQADPLRPARHQPVRTPAQPGTGILRSPLLHVPRRLCHL